MAGLFGRWDSPLGPILVACDGRAITGVWFWGQKYFAAGLGERGGDGHPPWERWEDVAVIPARSPESWAQGGALEAQGDRGREAAWAPAPVLVQAAHWLRRYFAGENPGPTPPLAPEGTPFRQAVWAALMEIPYGQTRTYGQLAQALAQRTGGKAAPRAVGGAVGHNPISLMIPCHRVVGAGGALTGYAGGLERKKALLALEKTAPAPPAGFSARTRSLALPEMDSFN